VCLKVLGRYRVTPSPDVLLIRAVSQDDMSPGDWTPLLGPLGILSPEATVRSTCLRAVMVMALQGVDLKLNPLLESRLWLMCFDEEEDVRALGLSVWEERGKALSSGYTAALVPLLSHEYPHVRSSAGRAIAGGIQVYPTSAGDVIKLVQQVYSNAIPPPKPPANANTPPSTIASFIKPVGGEEVEDSKRFLRTACGVSFEAIGVTRVVPADVAEAIVPELLQFILDHGVIDIDTATREKMVSAGRAIVDGYGDSLNSQILAQLEYTLGKKLGKNEDPNDFDSRHEAAVVLLGEVGKHLKKDDPHILAITRTLVTALDTPSETVQRSVADCLCPLVAAIKMSDAPKEMLEGLIVKCINGETYGQRRGAAFGISAFVKGLGLPCLKQFDVVGRLRDACTHGDVNRKQGSLFAFECLSDRLGLLFEPYIITIIPILLKSFSHSSDYVREAAQMAAKVIMSRLSAHGVKQILNPILTSLAEESAWKSRQEAIRLLGSMAYCAPKQLAACLHQIVPKLVEAGSDPHPKVKESAKFAMADLSSVIKNPEISRLVPSLLAAIADPASKTKDALDALLECEFMHSIDAPSLALLIPILSRALRDRGADLKRKGSTIMGNICSMISDPKTLVPYLTQVIPGLKDVLLDPIPDVRATSAKAIGSLMGGVGEAELSELVPWLISTLQTESSPVERSGAAQGLAEVCKALGDARMNEILSAVVALRQHNKAGAREGVLWYLSFLPTSVGDAFAKYISDCLPVVLAGLSDDSEGVREVALRGGQVIVSVYGFNHTLELLPSLTSGLFDEDWRIRQSSVTLLGELLYLVGDASAVGVADGDDGDDDDGEGYGGGGGGTVSRVGLSIRAHIGDAQTDNVLAALYIVRSDSTISVRQIALQVWKSVVSNTPRTLKQIMPALVRQIIEKLCSENEDLRSATGKALGEVVRKLGDAVLPEVVPRLHEELENDRDNIREGVCYGLAEILSATTAKQIEDYMDTLLPALQEALCDESQIVREEASRGFATLFRTIGVKAVAEIVPEFLARICSGNGLDDGDEEAEVELDERGLRGLQELVKARPRDLLEYLVPALLKDTMRAVDARILASVAIVGGNALTYHINKLVIGFINVMSSETRLMEVADGMGSLATGTNTNAAAKPSTRLLALQDGAISVVGAIGTAGVSAVVQVLGSETEHDADHHRRRWACWLFGKFCKHSSADYSDYVPVILKYLLSRVADSNRSVLLAVIGALSDVCETVKPEGLMPHLDFVRSCVSSTASDSKHRSGGSAMVDKNGKYLLPMLTIPQSLDPLLPSFLYSLLNGTATQRENAAAGLGELASMTEDTVLKTYMIKAAGPLIRVAGERFPSSVKQAIVQVGQHTRRWQ